MKRHRLAGFMVVVVACGLIAHLGAQVADRAEVLLQSARTKQLVEGRLEEAIELYQQVVKQSGANRIVAGKALLGMAQSYEKLGRPEARGTYAKLVEDYGDQPNVAHEARARLAAFAPLKAQINELVPRRISTDEVWVPRSVSVDGRLLVGNSGRDLFVRHLLTNQTTRLDAGSPQTTFIGPQKFSPDARQVAYGYADRASGTQPFSASIRVIGTQAGSQPRTLFGPVAQPSVLIAVGWSPDGRSVLSMIGSSLAWVSVTDGAVRTIKSWAQGHGPAGARLSPDGSLIAYSAPARPGSTEQHIYVIDANGQNETDVVHIAGSNVAPIWTPDGMHLLFISDRSGTRALWSVPMQGGKPTAEPSLLRAGFSEIPMAISQSGDLYYERVQGGDPIAVVAERSPAGASVVQTFQGMNPAWSRDGRSIGFVRPRQGQRAWDLIVRSVDSGEERLYPRDGIGPESPRWFHDGSGFLARTNEGGAEGSFCAVDVKTAQFTRCFPRNVDGHVRSGIGALSPDDKTLYVAVRAESPQAMWTGIVGIDPTTGTERSVATFPGAGLGGPGSELNLALSPDGQTLAMEVGAGSSNQARIMTIRVDGTGYREVYGPFPAVRIADLMRWTPDGRAILFVTSEATGAWRVMRIPATGGQPEPDGLDSAKLAGRSFPTLAPGGLRSIDLSPDGSRIAFGAATLRTNELWALENVMALLNARR